MRAVVVVPLLLLVVAGLGPADAKSPRDTVLVPVDERTYLGPQGDCLLGGVFCYSVVSPDGAPKVFLDGGASLAGLDLTVDGNRPLPDGTDAVLRIDCDPSGPACPGFLVEGRGALPLRVTANGLTAPAGAILRLYAYTEGGLDVEGLQSPFPDPTHPRPRAATIQGTLATHVDRRYVPPATRDIPVSFDGRTAPCGKFVEQCWDLLPAGNAYQSGPLDASVTDIRLTVTWSTLNPLAEELAVEVRCAQGDIVTGPDCQPWPSQVLTGTSPLTLEMHGLHTTTDSVYEILVTGPRLVGNDPTYHAAVRQDYHVEGAFTVLT